MGAGALPSSAALSLWKAESLPDQPYFPTRCQATNAVLLDGILRLNQGAERRSILQMDTQDGESTFFGVEVCRRVEFVPLLGIEEIHQTNIGGGFQRRCQCGQTFFDVAACHARRLHEDA